jgi:hypothetical protein
MKSESKPSLRTTRDQQSDVRLFRVLQDVRPSRLGQRKNIFHRVKGVDVHEFRFALVNKILPPLVEFKVREFKKEQTESDMLILCRFNRGAHLVLALHSVSSVLDSFLDLAVAI